MCKCPPIKEENWQGKKKYRLADFFDMHWDEYIKSPTEYVKPEQLKAVNAIRVCRTAVLGIDIYACPDCGEITKVYHSCKNRFCPTCSWSDTVKWAEKIKGKMINTKHRHIVCTLPHSLHPLIKRNEQELLSVLMRTAADTFKDWIFHKYGLKIGVISVLHTYGEQKEYHTHVHMIVSWGGIDKKTGLLKEISTDQVNYKFLKKKFRCKYEDELIRLNDKGELSHDYINRQEFMKHVKSINKTDWILHLEPSMDLPSQVVRYIGRYSKRACLSEYKITKIEEQEISFRYKDNKDRDENNKPKEKELCLHYREFFPRLLQHVPAKYFRIVRYYGIYSNKGNIPEEYLNKEGQESKLDEVKWRELQLEMKGEDPLYCTTCQQEKLFIITIFDQRKRKERTTKFKIQESDLLIHKKYVA